MKAGTPEKLDLNPIGTGPFQLQQYQKDSRIRYKAFDGYWGTKPQIDTLVFSITLTLPCVTRNCRRMNAR